MLKEWTISVEKLDGTDQIRWIPLKVQTLRVRCVPTATMKKMTAWKFIYTMRVTMKKEE